ncbi:MAG: hypothetical protein IJP91_07920, partial [Synergistaceae bacterium]|nr:hypothetical protein [Synergistaceae bacterium]
MKRFSKIIYFVIMALIVLSLSGCSLDHRSKDNGSSGDTTTQASGTLMVVSADVFKVGGTYRLYKGATVTTNAGTTPKDYVAPNVTTDGTDKAAMNLRFAETLSDTAFVFTEVIGTNEYVVLAHNPNGTDPADYTTSQNQVTRNGGTLQKYNGLTVGTSAVTIGSLATDDDEEIAITLTKDGTATFSDAA